LARSPEPSGSIQVAGVEAGAKERVLHLSGGRALRGVWSLDGEVYRLAVHGSGDRAVEIPRSAVVRATLVSELQAERKRLDRAAGKDLGRRVALADWLLREGLVQESLDELERILAKEPAHASALALLSSVAEQVQPFAGVKDLDPLLDQAASLTPVFQELALQRARELAGANQETLREELVERLHSRSERARALAARGLGRHFAGTQLKDLSVRAVLDGSRNVRLNSALALRQAGEEAVIAPAVKALSSQHGVVRQQAIAALADIGYPAAVEPLIARLAAVSSAAASSAADPPRAHVFFGKQTAYIQDFDVEVAQNAAVADPQVNALIEGAVLDARVVGVTAYGYATEAGDLRRSLERLTGAKPGSTSKSWLEWWDAHRHEYVPGAER
jgi:hypothetical protein